MRSRLLLALLMVALAGCGAGGTTTTPAPTGNSDGTPKVRVPSEPSSYLDFDGIGKAKLGASLADLRAAKLVQQTNSECGSGWMSTEALASKGVSLIVIDSILTDVILATDDLPTKTGARVGMTWGEVHALYGDAFTIETKVGNGGDIKVGAVKQADYELLFTISSAAEPNDQAMVSAIHARKISAELLGGC